MKCYISFCLILFSINLSFAQSLELEADQAYSKYVTTSNSNGSVVVLQNRIFQIDNLPEYSLKLGAINFVDSVGSTPGQIAYTTEKDFDNEFVLTDRDIMNFRIDGTDVMRLFRDANGNEYLRMSNGAICSAGGTWINSCSAKLKHLGPATSPNEVLQKINDLPIYQWSYKAVPSETHIGPTAEDFHDLFGVGVSSEKLAAVDLGGVSIAAIQALTEKIKILEEKINELENNSASKKQRKKKRF